MITDTVRSESDVVVDGGDGRATRWSLPRPHTIVRLLVVLLLGYLVLGPLAILFATSVRTGSSLPFDTGTVWTLESYVNVLSNPGIYTLLWDTIWLSLASLAVSFGISGALAWLIERTDLPMPNLSAVLVMIGLGVPGFLFGISWVLLANPTQGLLNELLRVVFGLDGESGPFNIFSVPGYIFLQGIHFVPGTFLLVAAAFRAMDVRMEEAAATSGAGRGTTLRRITLPVLAPALIGALIYMFITVVESFDIPLAVGLRADIHVLSTEVFFDIHPAVGFPNYAQASVHGVMLLLIGLSPLLYYNRILRRAEQFATISGKSGHRKKIELGRWRWPAAIGVGAYVLVSLVLPALVLFWTSIQPYFALPSLESIKRITFAAYGDVVRASIFQDALMNTLLLVIVAPLLVMLLALLVSWIVVRLRSRTGTLIDVIAFMPHVIPAPVLALALLLIYLMTPLPIYGTMAILVIGIVTRYLGLATRLMNAGVTSVQNELEEAAAVSGASRLVTLRRIVFPLVLPSFANGLTIVALLAIQQLAIPLMLASSKNVVFSTLVWTQWSTGATAPATALGVMVLGLTLVIAVLGRKFGGLKA